MPAPIFLFNYHIKDIFNINIMLLNWKKIKKEDVELVKKYNKKLKTVEYFNSIIYQMYNKMAYKLIDNYLVICKPIAIMGNFNIIHYCNLNIPNEIEKNLLNSGITLRGHHIKGVKDKFGDEYIYFTNNAIQKEGKRFSKFRNILRRYSCKYYSGFHKDVDMVVCGWSKENGSKHQIKLLKIIKENLDLVNITRVYYNGEIIGFSIVEKINSGNGVIIQRLINPNIKDKIVEPNILIHYYDCVNNPNMAINIGASRNKNIKLAKNKLRPDKLLRIGRKITKNKLNRKAWDLFNGNI